MGDVGHLIGQISAGGRPSLGSALCSLSLGCMMSIVQGALIETLCEPLIAVNIIGAMACACAIGMIGALVHYGIDSGCGNMPCGPKNPTQCQAMNAAIGGCGDGIGNLLGPLGGALFHSLGGFIAGMADQYCEQYEKNGKPEAQ